MNLLFWLGAIGAIYSYFLYPLVLLALPKRQRGSMSGDVVVPRVSIVITARNEETRIRQKLENTLAIDHPRDRLEVLVASDASTDATDDIVRSYAADNVRLVRAEERKGKEYAQSLAIRAATGDILVFSDVATDIPRQAVRQLLADFSDPRVGAVSSEDRFFTETGEMVGEGAYVRYEMWLRRLESSVNSLVGLSGSFFAARKEVCTDWNIHVPSDFNTALNSVRRGMIAVSDPLVEGHYKSINDERKEYQRKYRTVIRGIAAVVAQPDVLNPFRYGLFAFQVWSHKVMRWLVPWFLLLLLIATIALAGDHALYRLALLAQAAFYVLALTGLVRATRRHTAVKIPYFFMQSNAAIAHATVGFLLGRRVTVWEPSKR